MSGFHLDYMCVLIVVVAAAESLEEILKHWIWLEEEMLPVLGNDKYNRHKHVIIDASTCIPV